MQQVTNAISQAVSYLLSANLSDIIDMLIVAFCVYQLIALIRKTNTNRLARGVLLVLLVLWVSSWLQLTVVNYILRRAVEIGILALVILFQPELRRVFERVGSQNIMNFLRGKANTAIIEVAITQTVLACTAMSAERTGALIVFERVISLDSQVNTGTVINSDITAELMKNIFYNKAPLHDGAIIIRDGRLIAAGCVLPLSNNPNLSRDLGMRHRAAIGMSEHSDAVIAIVSEESGSISVAMDGMLKRHLAGDTFDKILRNELIGGDEPGSPSLKDRFGKMFGGGKQ